MLRDSADLLLSLYVARAVVVRKYCGTKQEITAPLLCPL
jgi:hypothetical protein